MSDTPPSAEQITAWLEEAREDTQVMFGLRSDLGPYEVIILCNEVLRVWGERDTAVRLAEQRAGEIAALEADVRAVLEDEAFVITRGAMSAQQWSDFKEWTFAALAAAAPREPSGQQDATKETTDAETA